MSYLHNSFGLLSSRKSVKFLCLNIGEVARVERYLNNPYHFKTFSYLDLISELV